MYEIDNEGMTSYFDGMSNEPSYLYLCSSIWRMFIKYPDDSRDLRSEKRLLNAAETLYNALDESDRNLLQFYGQRHQTREDSLAAYSYETKTPRQQIRTRFYYLCYLLTVQAGLINPFAWIPPQEHYNQMKKGKKDNG